MRESSTRRRPVNYGNPSSGVMTEANPTEPAGRHPLEGRDIGEVLAALFACDRKDAHAAAVAGLPCSFTKRPKRGVGMTTGDGLNLCTEAFGRDVVEVDVGHALDGKTGHVVRGRDAWSSPLKVVHQLG